MKIVVKTREITPSSVLSIEHAKYLSDFKIELGFSNGKSKIIDCKYFLHQKAHPSLKKYLKISEFKKFKVLNGNLNWNNYEMTFPIEQLYKGKVD